MNSKKEKQNSDIDYILGKIKAWKNDIVLFVNDVFQVKPTGQQIEILRAIEKPSSKVVVKAGRGVGKTAIASWVIIWHVLLFEDSKTPVTSPTSAQLKDVLLAEITKWLQKAPRFIQDNLKQTAGRLELVGSEATQFMSARTADPTKPDSLQGFHAEHMLFVVDECFGVANSIFETARAGLTSKNSRVLLIGNPTNRNCFAGKCFDLENWTGLTLSCLKSPLVDETYINELIAEYGKDSDLYRVHVLGEFPNASVCQLIPHELVEKQTGLHLREDMYNFAPIVIGVDVAYFGDDRSAVFLRQGLMSKLLGSWNNIEPMQLADLVAQFEDRYNADAVMIDATGVGAGVVSRLAQLGRKPIAIYFGARLQGGKYFNKRAESWGLMKEWLEQGGVLPPNIKGLAEELTTPEYFYHESTGQIQLESKKNIKARGHKSPDLADSLALTFSSAVIKKPLLDPYGLEKQHFYGNMDDYDPYKL